LSLIEVRDLCHSYVLRSGDSVAALRNVSFTIDEGEYVAVVGANGSGKTTLALHLNGILPPTAGDVSVAGLSTTNTDQIREIRSTVGMVFQSPDDQLVATVVEEDVAFGPENLGVDERRLESVVRESLERVGMWSERHRPPHQLSAGQKQRVAIAGALAMEPRCLVLDEATSMLDPAGARDVIHIAESLHAQGMTVITVTHKMEEAVRAERVLVLSAGELVADGSPADVFGHPDLGSWRLRPPAVTMLAERLRSRVPALPNIVLDTDTFAASLLQVGS
jgi:energy-coupling factor transporter ATPase